MSHHVPLSLTWTGLNPAWCWATLRTAYAKEHQQQIRGGPDALRPGCSVSAVPSSISLSMNDHSLPSCTSTLSISSFPVSQSSSTQLSDWRIMWSPQWKGTPSSGIHVFYYRTLCPEAFSCRRDKAMLCTRGKERGGEKKRSSTSFEYTTILDRDKSLSFIRKNEVTQSFINLRANDGTHSISSPFMPATPSPLLLFRASTFFSLSLAPELSLSHRLIWPNDKLKADTLLKERTKCLETLVSSSHGKPCPIHHLRRRKGSGQGLDPSQPHLWEVLC